MAVTESCDARRQFEAFGGQQQQLLGGSSQFMLLSSLQQIEPALPAILGHRSEHSFATGPVIPDPFISPLGLTMTPALSGKSERVSKKGASLVLTYLRSKGNGLLSF